MKLFKNWIFWGLLISLIGIVLGYAYSHSYQFGICYSNEATQTFGAMCRYKASIIGDKLFYPSIALAIVFLILLFIPRAVSAWKNFAIWYVPIFGFLIATAEPEVGGGFGLSGNIGPSLQEQIMWASIFYVVISLVAIAGSEYHTKTGKKIPWFLSPTFVALALIVLLFASLIGFLFLISP
jgi:hypothetical protein